MEGRLYGEQGLVGIWGTQGGCGITQRNRNGDAAHCDRLHTVATCKEIGLQRNMKLKYRSRVVSDFFIQID